MNLFKNVVSTTLSTIGSGIVHSVATFEYISKQDCCKQKCNELELNPNTHHCILNCQILKIETSISSNHFSCFKRILSKSSTINTPFEQSFITDILNILFDLKKNGYIVYNKLKYIEYLYERYNESFTSNQKAIYIIFEYAVIYKDVSLIHFIKTIGMLTYQKEYINMIISEDCVSILEIYYETFGDVIWKYVYLQHCKSFEMIQYLLSHEYKYKYDDVYTALNYQFVNNLSVIQYIISYILSNNIQFRYSTYLSNIENIDCIEWLLSKNINMFELAPQNKKRKLCELIKQPYKEYSQKQKDEFKLKYPLIYNHVINVITHNVQSSY